jgi:hypothetical protein
MRSLIICTPINITRLFRPKESKEMVRPPGTNGQKPPTEAGLPVPTSGTAGYGKTETKMETKNTLSFKGTGLKT